MFLVALEEHHTPASSQMNLGSVDGGMCKRKQEKGKSRHVESSDDDDDDDDDDDNSGLPGSEDNTDDEDDSCQKSYPKAPGQKCLLQLKIDNVCHVCIHTFSPPSINVFNRGCFSNT